VSELGTKPRGVSHHTWPYLKRAPRGVAPRSDLLLAARVLLQSIDMVRRACWSRVLGAAGAALFMAQVVVVSCNTVVSDQFECGVSQDDTDALARICNQAGEVCICNHNRCAARNGSCDSGYRYSFGNEDCVDKSDVASRTVQADEQTGFCPRDAPNKPCGLANGTACLSNQVCACAVNECAERVDEETCKSGYRVVTTSDCVDEADARPEVLLFPGDTANALCPAAQPLAPPCGVSIAGAAPKACATGQRCVCAGEKYACAYAAALCTSGYAWSGDASCIEDLSEEQVEDETLQVNDDGYCPDPGGAGGESGEK